MSSTAHRRVRFLIASSIAATPLVAEADAVVPFMTGGGLPDETLAVIDPVSGISSGTVGGAVRVGPGDIVRVRFGVTALPVSALRGVNAYVTVYVPSGAELVGASVLDGGGNVVEPHRAGLALDGCAGGGSCNAAPAAGTGSIAQVYADTGIFYSASALVAKNPATTPLALDAGVELTAEPARVAAEIAGVVGKPTGPWYAHNLWDSIQERGFGALTSPFANGDGNTGFGYGSPVAGTGAFYPKEVTDDGTLGLDGIDGPWLRIRYPGSQIGTGVANIGATSNVTRVGVATDTGALLGAGTPVAAKAVRFALGESIAAQTRFVEVALRVTQAVLDPDLVPPSNLLCAEAFGSDISSKTANTGGANNPWPYLLPHPACVSLREQFDLGVDRATALVGETLDYAISGRHLGLAATEADAVARFVSANQSLVDATPTPTAVAACADDSASTCVRWDLGTLSPSETFALSFQLEVLAPALAIVRARYESADEDTPATARERRAATVTLPIAAPRATLANFLDPQSNAAASPSNNWGLTGNIENPGSATWSSESIAFRLPSGWSLLNNTIVIAGNAVGCSAGSAPVCSTPLSYAPAQSRTLGVVLTIPSSVPAGLYPISLSLRGTQSVYGSFETNAGVVVQVPVGQVRSAAPGIDCPIPYGAEVLSGPSSELPATIELLVDGVPRGTGSTDNDGGWIGSIDASARYGGAEVRAIAQAAGELKSEPSAPCRIAAPTRVVFADGFEDP